GPDGRSGPDVVLLGRSGRPILSSLPAAMTAELAVRAATAGAPDAAAGERSWLATVQPLESTGWTLLLLADEDALSRRVTGYAWYLYPAIALLTVLFVAYAARLDAESKRTERERLATELEALRYQINPH